MTEKVSKKDKKKDKKSKKDDLEAKCEEYLQGWKRALADYENLQQDLLKQKNQARISIKEFVAQDLLPVIDNFEQAMNFAPSDEEMSSELKNWFEGVKYIQKQFADVMAGMGIEPIDTSGKFNPAMHDAAGEESDPEKEDDQILKVVIPGWKIGEKVLRPAKVIVNKKD